MRKGISQTGSYICDGGIYIRLSSGVGGSSRSADYDSAIKLTSGRSTDASRHVESGGGGGVADTDTGSVLIHRGIIHIIVITEFGKIACGTITKHNIAIRGIGSGSSVSLLPNLAMDSSLTEH